MRADVAILIVTYNSARHIVDCLRSVIEERQTITQQIIVLDNASTDETVAIVRARFPQVTVLASKRNLGFAAGVNMAARHADADYLLLLNPDTVVLDHAIEVVVTFARANPFYGLYGGRTVKPDGSLEPSSCWGLPSLWSLAMFACGLSTLMKRNRFFDPESLGSWPRDSVREVGVITGCFLLASRAAWLELQGFDERYFMYGEDTDLATRARGLGYRPVICPAATTVHEVGQSSETVLGKMLWLYRARASYIQTHWGSGLRARVGLQLLVFGVGVRALGSSAGSILSGRFRQSRWVAMWQQRRAWVAGYPPGQTSHEATKRRETTCLEIQ